MQTALNLSSNTQTQTIKHCCLIVDGNAHRPDLILETLPDNLSFTISEAMLPQIRATAMMIAASRHSFEQRSPSTFAEEADWFAARILVLKVRCFHLDVSLKNMLTLANQRAQAFAKQHDLSFTPAEIRMSLHANRPDNVLLMDCALNITENNQSIIENSRQLLANSL